MKKIILGIILVGYVNLYGESSDLCKLYINEAEKYGELASVNGFDTIEDLSTSEMYYKESLKNYINAKYECPKSITAIEKQIAVTKKQISLIKSSKKILNGK